MVLRWIEPLRMVPVRVLGSAGRQGRFGDVKRVEIVLARDSNQGEQGLTPGITKSRAHPLRRGGFGDWADRPVQRDPLAGGVRRKGGQPDMASVLVDSSGLDRGDLVLAQALAEDIRPLASEAKQKVRSFSLGDGVWIVAVRAFSGVSSPWALASAAAMAPNDHERSRCPSPSR